MKVLLIFLMHLVFLMGCNDRSAEAPAEEVMAMEVVAPQSPEYDMPVDKSADADRDNLKEDKIEAKIIREATLRFETEDLSATHDAIRANVKKFNGLIQNDTQGKDYNTFYRNITIRIPSLKFDAFINEISKGVAYFDQKQITANDVTEEYIDIDARIKTKKQLENRYLELLRKATKVSEILEIETQLSTIREEIESKEGRLKYLQNRVSMSSVSIEFYTKLANESGATVSYGSKIGNALKSGFNAFSSFFIGLIGLWPFIIILVAVFFLLRKRFKKKRQ
jgi:hypothetical protein